MNLEGFEDSGDVPAPKFKINKEFAKHYDKSRRSEELMKLKARYGDVNIKEEETDSESEDEDAEELTPAVEQKWLKALAALKSDDPRLYKDDVKFFDSDDDQPSTSSKKTKKKKKREDRVTLKDMDRKVIVERDGKYSDSENEDDQTNQGKSYYEEQDEIRQSIKDAQKIVFSDDEEEDMFKVKVKTAAEKEAEEDEYRKFIKGQEAEVDDKTEKDLAGLRDFWNRDDMTDADKFLKDYILEKRYIAEEESDDSSSESEEDEEGERHKYQLPSSEDEEAEKKAEQFEHKYNFRFEEPDPDFIKSYPRVVETTTRMQTSKRKEKRAATQERKDKEKKQKREELNRLRNLKKQEIEDKLKLLQRKSGAESMPFTGDEFDEDFDPDEHDKKMKEMFPDEDDDEELTKPTFDYDPEIDDAEDWDKYKVTSKGKKGDDSGDYVEEEQYLDPEDPNFVMDADYNPNAASLEDRNFGLDGRSKRSKKKKNRLKRALEKKKPLFNPDDKTFQEYLDDYYGLECEDMIGDLKCRFPYREVPANDFGLSVDEVLSARDNELNSWSSIKKTVQYRSNEEEYKDIAKFRRKGHDVNKKKRLLASVYNKEEKQAESEGDDEEGPSSSHKPTKIEEEPRLAEEAGDEIEESEEQPPRKKSKKAAKSETTTESTAVDSTIKDAGSKKRKAKWKGKQKMPSKTKEVKSSRGMSFKRMEAYGMHGEVKRVKKLRARDKRQ